MISGEAKIIDISSSGIKHNSRHDSECVCELMDLHDCV